MARPGPKEVGIDETQILNPQSLDQDVLFMLYYLSKDSFLMELYEVLGSKGLLLLVECFGGMTLQLPSREELKQSVRDYSIHRELIACVSDGERVQLRKELSQRHSLELTTIYKIEGAVSRELARVQDSGIIDRLRRMALKEYL